MGWTPTLGSNWQATPSLPEDGRYDHNARYYNPTLGRFISADTIVPNPGDPQSLNRYAYTLNNPLKYTDPSGHFEIDEIHRYLEQHLGIADEVERDAIINQWRTEETGWWEIIGPDGATYGDTLDSTKLNFLGRPGNRVHGQFFRDHQHDTFTFSGREFVLEMPGEWGSWDIKDFTSLVEFHDETTDVIWMRHSDTSGWLYQGGIGYAAKDAPIKWREYRDSLKFFASAFLSGAAGVGLVVASPEPFLSRASGATGIFISGVSFVQGCEHSANFARSLNAAYRLNFRVGQ
ncbi:MAG: RHS repeat-associated core domain-containing protein [Anaerolineae bacterium]|nr:RHS repeat-associated core domain-containing protein [Anaerolineae bacterium]